MERDDIEIGFEQEAKQEEKKLNDDEAIKLPDIFL